MDAEWRIRDLIEGLSDDVLSALRLYHVEMVRMNQTLSLISTYTEKNSDIIHFYDCIKASEFIANDMGAKTEIYDFGSGNGFPGIILAILYPKFKIHLIESDSRMTDFLRHMITRLELKNINLMEMKVENLKIPKAAYVTARSFSNLARTLLLSNKILPIGSVIYSLKGADWFGELASLPNQICSTWNTEMAFEYELPENLGTKVVLKSVRTS